MPWFLVLMLHLTRIYRHISHVHADANKQTYTGSSAPPPEQMGYGDVVFPGVEHLGEVRVRDGDGRVHQIRM